ncbi:5'-methylthioadenosine/adenosylhomocysteine nucleosidase [Thermoflavimicrobium dichotomicum]|uniref:adenosylhomocysteine nucleosidase n=1 Tax=Thermoflavimicrobium dichotomicum TaxID=46223 RepID=A0A1I3MKK8_9BACL|nr:5'-methylthioadenosine/adenosylhomocysteine nucleosidase [Thermoflavimicrobium dichotomicum]SFI97462.1 adenosylhomocysteine nucleosidase [Thermoflavimicrobium dichotomicum]
MKKIGLIGAMDSEIAHYLSEMESTQTETVYGINFHHGYLWNTPVVVCKSGVGKVNAAVCTQTLIDRFQVNQIIFTGVAGALHPDLDVGDIVISTECQYHDIDASSVGFPKGTIPFQETSIFPADRQLVELAVEAGKKMDGIKVLTGKILSGDQFISSVETGKALYEQMNGACVEMEGAAVAHVAFLAGIPYVVIRSMSDRADHSAHVNFYEFEKMAAERSCLIVRHMLNRLSGK